VTHRVIANPPLQGQLFTFAINTVTSRTDIVEYKTNLTDTAWQFESPFIQQSVKPVEQSRLCCQCGQK